MELTILMPCLNEAATLSTCIRKARQFLTSQNIVGEVLIADNGSQDGSQEIAATHGARVISVPVRGYGAALIAGIKQAKGRFVIMGDCDDSYDFSDLGGFVAALRQGAQLVMGNRFAGGIRPGAMPILNRYLGNPILSFLGRLFFRSAVRDFHCGLRGFDRAAVLKLGLKTTGMEFASEMVVKASLAGLRIREVPTILWPDGRARAPHLRPWRDGWRHLRFLLLFCPRWLFFYPGAVFLLIGLLGMSLLSSGPVSLPTLGFGIHSLLYMMVAIVLGVQLLILAGITHWSSVWFGFRTKTKWLDHWPSWLGLEVGGLSAFLIFMSGLVWSASLFGTWRALHFGPLDPVQMMRQVIPAVTLMMVGGQLAMATFFVTALDFYKPSPAADTP